MFNLPKIVCLIGSSRFRDEFVKQGYRLETTGHLVLCMTFFAHTDNLPVSPEQRSILEDVDEFRIELCDEVLVIDANRPFCTRCEGWVEDSKADKCCSCGCNVELRPYIGESTVKEIHHATIHGKPVRYLSKEPAGE